MAKTAAGRSAGETVVALKVTLRDVKPPVWRRLLLPGTMTLADLHEAIQAAMGWHGGHLHAFDVAGRQYGDPRTIDDVADETKLTLNGLLRSGVARFTYTYDLGDNWEHQVLIERTQPALDAGRIPPASQEGATALRRTAAALGATPNSWPPSPIPPIPNTPTSAPGSARTSTPTSSTSMPPMRT
jgi:hypothetical protein